MYNPHAVLDGVDAHVVPFLLFSAISFAGLILWYYEAITAAERDRCISMPPIITMAWLVHDATLVAHYSDWFGGPYDHWLMKLYWVAMIGTASVEIVFVVQLLRFGREELAPRLSPVVYRIGVLAALAGTLVLWLALKRIIADDLFQVTFALTAAMFPPFGMALLLRRGDRRGQTVRMWVGFTIAPAGWWVASVIAFGPPFRSALWIALGAVVTAWGALTTVLVARAPDGPSRPAAAGIARPPLHTRSQARPGAVRAR